MNEIEEPDPKGVSRRTVTKAMAWAVPVIAVRRDGSWRTPASVPPPPVIDFGGACGHTGALQKGCGSDKSLQVPLTLTNPGSDAIVFQITGMLTSNGNDLTDNTSQVFPCMQTTTFDPDNICTPVTPVDVCRWGGERHHSRWHRHSAEVLDRVRLTGELQ